MIACILLIGGCILLVFLLLSICIRLAVVMREVSRYSVALADISSGNHNRRLRCKPSIHGLADFTRSANAYTEQLQKVSAEKRQLEHAQKMMISNISHDLRTPLTSILGYLQVLQSDSALSDRERADFLAIIMRKSESLYSLLESFFELSKLEADTESFAPVRLNINEELENALSALYREFNEKRIDPIIDLPAEPLFAWGNQASLQRILDNLLTNALTHAIDAKEIGASARREGERIIVSVWDTGQGIDQTDMPLVFDRLYVSDETRRRNIGGGGLGLAIARRLVEKLGGEISARSEPGVKTEFTFFLLDAS